MDPRFNFKDIETPKGGLIVYTNSYWLCENGDTKKALFYGDSPQCNSNESIIKRLSAHKMYSVFNLEIVFVPIAFIPIRK